MASVKSTSDTGFYHRFASQMKSIFKLICFSCLGMSWVAIYADDTPLKQLGESVDLDAKAPAVNVTVALPRPGYESVLDRLLIEPKPGTSPLLLIVSGRVISDNTGMGIERVAIFVGQEGEAPELAAMTNADGDFKFRLWIRADRRNLGLNIPPDFSGYLYVGGDPSLTHRQVLRLMSGYTVRYKFTDLASRNQLKLPVVADSDSEANHQTKKK